MEVLLAFIVLCFFIALYTFLCMKIAKIRGGEDSSEVFLISFFLSPLLGVLFVIAQLIRDHNEDYVNSNNSEK